MTQGLAANRRSVRASIAITGSPGHLTACRHKAFFRGTSSASIPVRAAKNSRRRSTIEISATLLNNRDQRIVARHTFLEEEQAAATDVGTVTEAFGRALGTISGEIAGWALVNGQGDVQAHPAP